MCGGFQTRNQKSLGLDLEVSSGRETRLGPVGRGGGGVQVCNRFALGASTAKPKNHRGRGREKRLKRELAKLSKRTGEFKDQALDRLTKEIGQLSPSQGAQ